jgi:hypothetical protein
MDGNDWSITVRDPEVKLSAEGLGFVMWLTVAWWIIVIPSPEEISVLDSKAASSNFSLDPHFDSMAYGSLVVEEVYMSIVAIEITSAGLT